MNGTAITWETGADKALKSSTSYFSKEPDVINFASWVLHKDSSLKVQKSIRIVIANVVLFFLNSENIS